MKNFILLFLLSGISSCGYSPLLHHHNASDSKNSFLTTSDLSCPIKFSNSNWCAKIEWNIGPASNQENFFTLKFWDHRFGTRSGPYLSPTSKIDIKATMPLMPHGSSPIKVLQVNQGIYQVRRLYFFMPGDWIIRIKLLSQTSIEPQASIPLSVH